MTAITMKFDNDNFWQKCKDNDIDPDFLGNIAGWLVTGSYIYLWDSASGILPTTRTFVLISPELNNATIRQFLAELKTNRVSVGFTIDDALFYQKVIIIGTFPDPDLLLLQNADVDVRQVPAGSPAEMRAHLAGFLL